MNNQNGDQPRFAYAATVLSRAQEVIRHTDALKLSGCMSCAHLAIDVPSAQALLARHGQGWKRAPCDYWCKKGRFAVRLRGTPSARMKQVETAVKSQDGCADYKGNK